MRGKIKNKILLILLLLSVSKSSFAQSGNCDATVPFFQADLSSDPNTYWESASAVRQDYCCGTKKPDRCIEFEITLHPNTVAIQFDIASGAMPGGSMFFQIDCGPAQAVGTPVCVSGVGPHTITFCKPGKNENTYSIQAFEAPNPIPDVAVADGCQVGLKVNGLVQGSITWRDITGGGVYDTYLDCTSGCDTVTATPTTGYPSFVDYEVSGNVAAGPCSPTATFIDTVRVNFYPPIDATVSPDPATFCSVSSGIELTANGVGGVPPLTYRWTDAPAGGGTLLGTNQTYTAITAGTFYVEIRDAMYPNCPAQFGDTDVSVVFPDDVDAGSDQTICETTTNTNISGTIVSGTNAYWSGNGTFGDINSLNTNYEPTALERNNGLATIMLISSGNVTCPPDTDYLSITIVPDVELTLSGDDLVCFGETGSVNSSILGGSGIYTYAWSSGETTANIAGKVPGSYDLTVTETSAAGCNASASFTINENPEIIASGISNDVNSCQPTTDIISSVSGGDGSFSYAWNNGAITADITVGAGTYVLNVTDGNSCSASFSTTVNLAVVDLDVTIDPVPMICHGETTNISATTNGGVGTYVYSWTTGESSNSINKGAGIYKVIVTDDWTCVDSAEITVIEGLELTSSISANNVLCNGGTGDATIATAGGTGTITYLWDNGQTTATATSLIAGDYSVIASDVNGCTTSQSITITEPTILASSISSNNVLCQGGTGDATISTSGGTGIVTYLWNSGQKTATASSLLAGDYSVTATDANSCKTSQLITITEPIKLTSSISLNNVLCNGGTGDATISVSGGTGTITYLWSDGQTTAASTLGVGNHAVTATDANGCTTDQSLTITEPAALSLSLTKTDAACNGQDGTITSTVSGGTIGYTYSWDNGSSTADITTGAGTYSLTVTDANGCTAIASETITQPDVLAVTLTTTDVNCNGGNGTITSSVTGGTTNYTYAWDNAATTADIKSTAGTYALTVTDAQGCTASASETISEPTVLTSSITSNNVSCNGGNGDATITTAGGTGAITYLWSDGQTTATATLAAGSYSVTATDAKGCTTDESVTITEPADLSVSLVKTDAACNGQNGTITSTVSGGTTNYTYAWDNGLTTADITNTAGTFSLTVTDANGCTSTASETITQPDVLTVTLTTTDVTCNGGNGTITSSVTGGTSTNTYAWDNAATTADITSKAGTYVLIVTDAQGCTASATETISEPTVLTSSITSNNVSCNGGNGDATINTTGGTGLITYLWSDGQTTATATLAAGSYSVTATDANGCTTSESVTITEPAALNLSLTKTDAACNGQNGTITSTVSGGTTNYTYAWDNSATTTEITTTAGTYSLTVTDANGCTATASETITQPDLLVVTLTATDVTCNGGNESITSVVTGGTSTYTYAWDNAATTADITSIAGTYALTVTDAQGCIASATETISEPNALGLTGNIQDVSCNRGSDGAINITVSGGTGLINYNWSQGSTTNSIISLSAGAYSVTATDLNGCTLDTSFTISEPSQLIGALTPTNVSCNGGNDGSLLASANGGISPYTFIWSNGSTNDNIQNITAGDYTVSVTDANECSVDLSESINEPNELKATISIKEVACFGGNNGEVAATLSGGVPPYSFEWDKGETQNTIQSLSVGDYSGLGMDSKGCSVAFSGTVTSPSALTVGAIADPTYCGLPLGNAIASVLGGGVPPYNFEWEINPTRIINNDTASNLYEGAYIVQVIDANGCSTVQLADVVDVSVGGLNSVLVKPVSCFGGRDGIAEVSFSGNAIEPFSYTWVNVNTNVVNFINVPLAIGLPAGSYVAKMVDANGCEFVSDTMTITQPEPLLIDEEITHLTCYGVCEGKIDLNVSGGTAPYVFNWGQPDVTKTEVINDLCFGDYSVDVVDANGCDIVDYFNISTPAELIVQTGSVTEYCDLSDGVVFANATGGTGAISYSWDNGLTGDTLKSQSADNFVVTVVDENGCSGNGVVNLVSTAKPDLQITLNDSVKCFNQCDGVAEVNLVGNIGSINYNWEGLSGNSPTQYDLCAVDYKVIATDEKGCKDSTIVSIGQPTSFNSSTSKANPLCNNSSDGWSHFNVTGGTMPYVYVWTNELNEIIANSDSLTATPSGIYTVKLTDAKACKTEATVTLDNPAVISNRLTATPVTCAYACDGGINTELLSGDGVMTYNWSNGETTQNLTGLCEGTYRVIIQNENGCSNEDSIIVTQPDSLLIDLVALEHVACNGESNGFIQISVAGGNGSYVTEWSNGATSMSNNSLVAGSYTVSVRDSKGCFATATYIINQPEELVGNLILNNVTCYDACNGSAIYNLTGGTAPYDYLWIGNASDSSMATGLCNNNYSVNVTDANGCKVSDDFSITQPAPIAVTADLTSSNCGMNTGAICINTKGGTGVIKYNWSDTAFSSCISDIYAGCFDVKISDENGCDFDTILCINDISAPTLTVQSSTNIACYNGGDGSLEFSAEGGDGELTFNVFNNLGKFEITDGGVNGLIADCYIIEVMDVAGCKASEVICLTQPDQLMGTTIVDADVSCYGLNDGEANVIVNGGVSPYSYNWSTGTTTAEVKGLPKGDFTVNITDANGCELSESITINQPDSLIANVDQFMDLTCYESCDGAIALAVTGGSLPYSYTWSSGGVDAIDIDLCAGQYLATITDANGCSDTVSQIINQPDSIFVDYSTKNAICGNCNGEADLTAIGGNGSYTYDWMGAGAFSNAYQNRGLCPDDYPVIVADKNGCTQNLIVQIGFEVEPQIDSLTVQNTSCFNGSNGTAEVFAKGVAPFTYEWADGTSADSKLVNGLKAGSYCVIVTDANGCKISECAEIESPTEVIGHFTAETKMCYGNSHQVWINAEGGTGDFEFTWQNNAFIGAGPHDLNPYEEKEYCFTVTDSLGCISNPVCFNTEISDPLVVSADEDKVICEDQTALLHAFFGGGNRGPYNVDVYANEPYTGELMTSTLERNRVALTTNPENTTTYYFVVSDGCSEDAIDSVTVFVNIVPEVELASPDSSGCSPFVMPFNVTTNVRGAIYEFDFDGDGEIDYSGPEANHEYVYNKSGIFKVTVNVISPDSCRTAASAENYIICHATPEVEFEILTKEASMVNSQVKFEATYKDGNYFTWRFGDGDSISGYENDYITTSENSTNRYEAPYHNYQDSGWYNVEVDITGRTGCIDSYEIPIYIQPSFTYYAPTAFTPNGDGINENFIPEGIGWQYDQYNFTVWSRWGELVYESNSQSEPWDGTYMGRNAQQDTYVWQIEFRDIVDNKKHLYTGHVNLIR